MQGSLTLTVVRQVGLAGTGFTVQYMSEYGDLNMVFYFLQVRGNKAVTVYGLSEHAWRGHS